ANRWAQLLDHYVLPPGSGLVSRPDSACSMTIRSVVGIAQGPTSYRPASVITVPNAGSETYILAAFCLDSKTDDPSESTTFTLKAPVRALSCIAREGAFLSVEAYQAAVWIYRDKLTF